MIEDRTRCPDDESLAGLTDGAVGGDEREAIVEHLVGCERCFEIFSETLRVQLDHDSTGSVAPGSSRLRAVPWLSIAAAAVLVVMVGGIGTGVWTLANRDPHGTRRVARLLPEGEPLARLGPFWNSSSLWSSRGAGVGVVQPSRAAYRLGARQVDVELAIEVRDQQAARAALRDLEESSLDVDSLALVVVYQELAEAIVVDEPDWTQVQATAALVKRPFPSDPLRRYFELGRWVQTARVAAIIGDEGHFARRSWRQGIRDLRSMSLSQPAQEAVQELDVPRGADMNRRTELLNILATELER